MIRHNFPPEGGMYKNGRSDGWIYQVDFYGGTDDELLAAVRKFLDEAGYSDVALPLTGERLFWDYLNPDSFSGGCYVYHPIKIGLSSYRVDALHLIICNEDYPDHKEFWKNSCLRNE